MTNKTLLIVLFGVAGVLARYFLDQYISPKNQGSFPISIFVINILGCGFAGFFFALFQHKDIFNENIKIAISVGLLGGFTTFSAFSLDLLKLSINGNYSQALIYGLLSPTAGFLSTLMIYHFTTRILLL